EQLSRAEGRLTVRFHPGLKLLQRIVVYKRFLRHCLLDVLCHSSSHRISVKVDRYHPYIVPYRTVPTLLTAPLAQAGDEESVAAIVLRQQLQSTGEPIRSDHVCLPQRLERVRRPVRIEREVWMSLEESLKLLLILLTLDRACTVDEKSARLHQRLN